MQNTTHEDDEARGERAEEPRPEDQERGSLGRALGGAALAAAATAIAARSASARPTSGVPLLVQVFLRGGADGLTLLCPYDDPNYRAKRPNIRVPSPGETMDPLKDAIPLTPASGNVPAFGLPPALEPLKALFLADKLAFVHACGSKDPSRSHFEQQLKVEHGEIFSTLDPGGQGWLGRHLATSTPVGNGSLRALSLGNFAADSFDGGNGVTPTLDPEQFSFPGDPSLHAHLDGLYTLFGEPLATALSNDLEAVAKLSQVDWNAAQGSYPATTLGKQFRQIFAMAKDIPDLEIVNVDFDNNGQKRWDTHDTQGVFDGTPPGGMFLLMDDLARSLSAFIGEIAGVREVCILVLTEFGRTLDENSSLGTDHGRGGVAMVLGDRVNGGQVVTDWPGLDEPNLDPPQAGGDMQAAIDIRDVQAEIAVEILGNSLGNVFPDANYSWTDRALIGP